MNSWQKVNSGQIRLPVQIKSDLKAENRKEENLRISGEKIMRIKSNATAKMNAKKRSWVDVFSYKAILQCLKWMLLSTFMSLTVVSVANAIPIAGRVFLDYDDTAKNVTFPLQGLSVTLKDDQGILISNEQTNDNGQYNFEVNTLGNYIVEIATNNGESVSKNVTVRGATGELGQNLFLKGKGGTIHLKVKNGTDAGINNIPVKMRTQSTVGMVTNTDNNIVLKTDSNGEIEIKNTLLQVKYEAFFDKDVDLFLKTRNYKLWDVILPDNSHQYAELISFKMEGSDQSGQFNLKHRNTNSVDGVVVVDRNNNNTYEADIDTGLQNMRVELYYSGTTTKVMGTDTVITGGDGKYSFSDLAVATYDIQVTNVTSPPFTTDSKNRAKAQLTIPDSTGVPSGPNFLFQLDPNDTSLSSISGNVFVLGPQQYIKAGPDSGKTGNNIPLATLGSTGLNTTVELYQHNGTDWEKIAYQFTGNLGAYQFVGLVKDKDYKVVVTESNINLNNTVFVNDTDGKSTSTSSKSRSTHKGKVTLSNGTQANIAAKEIIVPKLNERKTNQNFWYSPIRKDLGNLLVVNYLKTANGEWSWSSTINGLEAITASTYTKIAFFEEDGVTQATDLQGNKLEVSYQKPGFYGVRGSQNYPIDHAGLFYYSVVEYDTDNLDYPESYNGEYSINVTPNRTWEDTLYFTPKRPNTISGYVYLNNSHRGALGTYNPNQDTPIKQNRVTLERKVFGKWTVITEFATDNKGYYNFTNLPNGEYRVTAKQEYGGDSNIKAGDVDFENNDQNSGSSIDPNDNKKTISSIVVNASGGNKYNRDTNIWYKLKINEDVLRGSVLLDTWLGDGEIQTGQMYNANDLPLKNAIVLLCEDDGTNDCTENGSNFIGKKLTNAKGEYSFQGQQDGINRDVTYIVKAIYSGTTAVTNTAKELAPSYKVQFKQLDVPMTKNFLMQGKGQFSGAPVNDLNGDMDYAGEQTLEKGDGYFDLYFWNGSNYEKWSVIGDYYRTINLKSLPEGKYRIVHQADKTKYLDIADKDPSSPPGTVNFEVLADGTLANMDDNNQWFMQATIAPSGLTEALSGNIYLDITGSTEKNEQSVLLTSDELQRYNLSDLSVEGVFTPRIYPNYYDRTKSIDSILADPDFVDNKVKQNGRFVYNKQNSTRYNNLYLTSMLLRLNGLDHSAFKLVGNSSASKTEKTYLPNEIKTNLEYMQVYLLPRGVPNQYWLIRANNNTEISGQLYYDYDDNGSFDASKGDVPITGVRVEIYRKGSNKLYSYTKTDNNGKYRFSHLLNDNYTIKVTDTGLDKRYELKSPSDTVNDVQITASTPILSGGGLDFIYKKEGDASISGYVMIDINNNGQPDISFNRTGDVPVSNVTINLYKGSDATGTPFSTIKTNEIGYYSFSLSKDDSKASLYTVEIEPPSGYGVIANADNNTNKTLNPISFNTKGGSQKGKYFLLAGKTNANPSAGINSTTATNSGISGKTLIGDPAAATGEPLGGVLLSLYDATTNKEMVRQYSDANGEYHFYNLPDGNYKVSVILAPQNYVIVGNSENSVQPIDTISNIIINNRGIDGKIFYYNQASYDGIQGNVYIDFNDSNQDLNHTNQFAHPLDGSVQATVELYSGLNASGQPLMTQKTNNGHYHFANLLYGTGVNYSVKIIMNSISDYDFKQSKSGNQAQNIVIPVSGLPLEGSLDNHYLVLGKQKIGGDVWIDFNNNKIKTVDELTNGVKVNLNYKVPGSNQYKTLKTIETDNISLNGNPSKNGQYLFEKLPINYYYQVEVITPDGAKLIPASEIANNKNIIDFMPLTNDDFSSSTGFNYDGIIAGQVTIDVDNSQSKTDVDTSFAGVKLNLTKVPSPNSNATNNQATFSVITDSSGNFKFENMSPGQWVLSADNSQTVADWNNYALNYTSMNNRTIVGQNNSLSLDINLTVNQPSIDNINIGYRGSSKITGYVVIDRDDDDQYSQNDMAFGQLSTPITPVITLNSANNKSGFTPKDISVDPSTGAFEIDGLSQHNYEITSTVNHNDYKLVFSPGNPATPSAIATFDINGPNDSRYELNPEKRAFGYQIKRNLSGTVYLDASGNGSYQTFHTKLEGAVVKIEGEWNNKKVTYTQTVGGDGNFLFNNITEGKWTVSVSHPTRSSLVYSYFVKKSVNPTGTNTNSISYQVDSNTGRDIKLDLGMKGQSIITGMVVLDNDVDEQLSQGDTGIANLTINLIDPTNDTVIYKQTNTGSNGYFEFNGLSSGNYRIRVTDPANALSGYVISFSPTGKASTNNAFDIASVVVSADNDQKISNDFGYKGNIGISGHIYQDIMGNAIHNANYPTLSGVEVSAINQSNNAKVSSVSLADGSYAINNLTSGVWIVKITGYPQDWNYSYVNYAVNYLSIDQVNPGELKLTISATDTAGKTIDYGLKGSAKIAGRVVVDMDINDNASLNYHAAAIDRPLNGIPVTLKSNGLSGAPEIRTTTDSNGHYQFDNLTAYNQYEVSVDDSTLLQSGYQISFSPAMVNGGNVSNHDMLVVAGVNQQVDNIDYGYKSQKALKGKIYKDYSGKGIHQTYHTTLAGVTVEARDANNPNILLTAVSDANGQYEINNIAEGEWIITVQPVAGSGYSYSYVVKPQGMPATDVPNGTKLDMNAASSPLVTNVDFGLKGQASISGQVVIDIDTNDGNTITAQDIGIDSLFPHYAVELFVENDLVDSVEAISTGTNIDDLGQYKFENLVSGVNYKVKVSIQNSNYISSFLLTDSNIAATTNKTDNEMEEIYQFASATDHAQGVIFAWSGISGIKGKVFLDNNDDGEYNPSIDSSVNAPVTLLFENVNNPAIHFTHTLAASDVDYEINNIIPGKWKIEVTGIPTTLRASFDPDDAHHDRNGTVNTPKTENVATLDISGSLIDQNFGYINGGFIEGRILDDNQGGGLKGAANYNGLKGVNVYLLDSDKQHILDKSGQPVKSISGENGKFSFRNLIIDTNNNGAARYFVRVLYGEYNDGSVNVGRGNPLFDLIPSFDQYADNNGKVIEHDLINLANPPASVTFNGVGGAHTVPVMLKDMSTTLTWLANEMLLGYRNSDEDVTIIKMAQKDNVVVGDIVPYSIRIINNSPRASAIKIQDILPAGFKFVKGSTRLDGKKVADPSGGRTVTSQVIKLKSNDEITLTYMLVVGSGVTQGEYTNTAKAINSLTGRVVSNISHATVTVTADPLFDDALIFGKVYVDKNGNCIQDEGEEGLGGIKLVTARGEIITTDAIGRYHLVGVSGGRWERGANFVIKLDTRTLPKGYEVIGRNPKVIRVSPGLPSKVDFLVSEVSNP